MNEELKKKIKDMIESDEIVLFMKGTKEAPRCGFSKIVVDMLKAEGIEFTAYNVLEDEEIRSGLKEYSSWPTFPQLYSKSQLIGGCDIIRELYEEGELQSSL